MKENKYYTEFIESRFYLIKAFEPVDGSEIIFPFTGLVRVGRKPQSFPGVPSRFM